ncbi:MAG TPA: hypothetical protein VE987_10450 [Polyangiaceae bacterium]|nr:hypothetical protein [Polyangiaceae bacterium]
MASKTTTDHEEIRQWAESRGGKPACISGTGRKNDPGMLRVMFPDSPFANDANLREMSWDDWLEAFDANGLALVYEEQTADGEPSRFNKIIARSTAEARAHGESGASVHHPHGR